VLKRWLLERLARRIDPQLWERIDGHPKPIMDVIMLGERQRSLDEAAFILRHPLS